MRLVLAALACCAAIGFANPASACRSPAAYRSVVLNVAPPQIPEGAVLLKVRIDSGLYSALAHEVQGLRGKILQLRMGATAATHFEIIMHLGSMCDTWVEIWSSDHDSTDGVLTGYIVGYPRGMHDGFVVIEPLLFQAAAYRQPNSTQLRGRVSEGAVRRLDSNATWRLFRVDAAALAQNLDGTNAQIQSDLERKDRQ